VRTLATCIPIRDERGDDAGALVVVSDLSEPGRVHDEVARAEKLRALGDMAGGVAHDFNNVLTVILGNTQFLLLEDLPEDTLDTLRAVERAALDGTETVRRIREFAKHRAVSVNAALVSVDQVVGDVMAFVRKSYVAAGRARAAEYRVTVERRSRRLVRGDADQLKEALAHIVENAFDAMPDGGTLRVETFDRGEDSIAVRVTDSGVGMTPEQAKKVFDPFYTTKSGGRCTGLGLSIAFGIVRAHRGRIDLRSEPGCGTTFAIVLPAAAGAVEKAETGDPVAAPAEPADRQPRLLLVAADRAELEPLVAGLRSLGVVATAASADAAVALLSGVEIFNVLVVDRDAGGASGWELARQARAVRDELRIVLVTGPEEPVSETQARNAGIDRVLVRPMDARDLQAESFALLASPRERSAAPEPASVRNRAPAQRRVRMVECVASTTEVWARGSVRPTQELASEGPDDTAGLLAGRAQDPLP
jgi:nitrogen-specific signal transduction histidine kinase/CheY-like chemotaxis protein